MGENSKIGWTTHSFNTHWGCQEVSPACDNCYARTWALRMKFDLWGKDKPRRTFGPSHWAEPLKWHARAVKAGRRDRVFVNSMSDTFEDHPDLPPVRKQLFDLIDRLASVERAAGWPSGLDFLLLTKRPENVGKMIPSRWIAEGWPGNVWLGSTAENQRRYNERMLHLMKLPAAVRFVSAEPLLGPIVLAGLPDAFLPDWVITGCESGRNPRLTEMEWIRSLRDQCSQSGISFFYKQGAVDGKIVQAPDLDGRTWLDIPEAARGERRWART